MPPALGVITSNTTLVGGDGDPFRRYGFLQPLKMMVKMSYFRWDDYTQYKEFWPWRAWLVVLQHLRYESGKLWNETSLCLMQIHPFIGEFCPPLYLEIACIPKKWSSQVQYVFSIKTVALLLYYHHGVLHRPCASQWNLPLCSAGEVLGWQRGLEGPTSSFLGPNAVEVFCMIWLQKQHKHKSVITCYNY